MFSYDMLGNYAHLGAGHMRSFMKTLPVCGAQGRILNEDGSPRKCNCHEKVPHEEAKLFVLPCGCPVAEECI